MDEKRGFLFIGDPHVANRPPGFRRDEYARTVLTKLRWAMDYAQAEKLMPVLLGDLFDSPHNVQSWIILELMRLFRSGVWAVVGNHDRREDTLNDFDSLSLLVESGAIRLLDRDGPWSGTMNGCPVALCGSGHHQRVPEACDLENPLDGKKRWVFWVLHHNIRFPSIEEEGFKLRPRELPGIDMVVNGHIHRALDEVICGRTRWQNPGNITRLSRGESSQRHVPCVFRVDVHADRLDAVRVPIPVEPYDAIFLPITEQAPVHVTQSVFIRSLQAIESARTASGAGLNEFLDANLDQFRPPVRDEIRAIAKEVLDDAKR